MLLRHAVGVAENIGLFINFVVSVLKVKCLPVMILNC